MFQKQKQKVKKKERNKEKREREREKKKKKVAFRASNLKAVLHRNFVKKKKKKRGPKSLVKKMHV